MILAHAIAWHKSKRRFNLDISIRTEEIDLIKPKFPELSIKKKKTTMSTLKENVRLYVITCNEGENILL